MTDINFNEEDREKVIEFLNMVAKHAKFEMNTVEIVQYFKLLSHMQQKLLPKITENIMEVKRVIQPKEEATPAEQPQEAVKKGKK